MQQPKLPVLVKLAEALKVRDLAQLIGGQPLPMTLFQGPGHPALPAVRGAINAVAVTPDVPRRPSIIWKAGSPRPGALDTRPLTTERCLAACCLI